MKCLAGKIHLKVANDYACLYLFLNKQLCELKNKQKKISDS